MSPRRNTTDMLKRLLLTHRHPDIPDVWFYLRLCDEFDYELPRDIDIVPSLSTVVRILSRLRNIYELPASKHCRRLNQEHERVN